METCERCGTSVTADGYGSWIDETEGDSCEDGSHQPAGVIIEVHEVIDARAQMLVFRNGGVTIVVATETVGHLRRALELGADVFLSPDEAIARLRSS